MEQKKDRKILKRIGAIVCALALTIVAFALPFSTNFKNNLSAKNMIASADEVVKSYHYSSNDTYYIGVYDFNNAASGAKFMLFNGAIDYSVNSGVSFRVLSYISETNGLSALYGSINNLRLITKQGVAIQYGDSNTDFSVNYNTPYRLSLLYESFDFSDFIYVQEGFDANIYRIDMFLSSTNEFVDTARPDGVKFFNIKYFDLNNKYFVHSFMVASDFKFNERSYYIQNPDSFNDNQFYREGYSAGESAGYSAGETAGYSSGYKAGETIGYNNGYSAGVEHGGEYTFFSLISAVIDAPIQAFMGLFNFELLGINLAGFFTGLLTLAFIITIVRLIMP